MKAMGDAYTSLLPDRNALLFQMQSYAACADPEIQDARARGLRHARAPGAGRGRRRARRDLDFFSHGMLLNVIAAVNLDVLAVGEEWAACWVEPGAMLEEAAAAQSG